MSSEDIFAIEDEFIQKIEQGIRSAERLFSMIDVEEDDDEALCDMQDRLYHCEVCTVREVLEITWPPVDEYISWLRSQIPLLNEVAK